MPLITTAVKYEDVCRITEPRQDVTYPEAYDKRGLQALVSGNSTTVANEELQQKYTPTMLVDLKMKPGKKTNRFMQSSPSVRTS